MSDAQLLEAGGSLLIAWQLQGKRVLIVGGGDVASGRIKSILVTDALITLISPRDGLHPETKSLIEQVDRISYHDRLFSGPDDLLDIDLALTAIDDMDESRRICMMCRERKIPVNVADIPPMCDFYFGSQIRRGPLQIMISTNGNGPKLASMIKARIENSLPPSVGQAIVKVGALRVKLRERAPGVGGDLGKKRMRWMSRLCSTWELDDLARLDDIAMQKLLDDGWEAGRVPKPAYVGIGLAREELTSRWQIWPESGAYVPMTFGFVLGGAVMTAFFLLRRRT